MNRHMTNGWRIAAVLGVSAAAWLATGLRAAEPSARDIMEKNFFVTKVSTLQLESTMVLINEKG